MEAVKKEEQERLERVKKELETRIKRVEQEVQAERGQVIESRKCFWDDITINFDDSHEMAETLASLKQHAEGLSEKERRHLQSEKQLKTLLRLQQSPYFGRVEVQEEGVEGAEQVYIGVASFMDEDDLEFLVYDWRAPISSLYYDFLPGPVSYDTPGGIIHGTMKGKRQYIIRNGSLISLFDTGVTIGDELLQEVLGKQQADAQMKSIVATIQREQNEVIRNERSRLLVVQGAAGSGKTSAALQRVAYLLYRYRGKLSSDQIVLFSPNRLFNSYVSTVLPELGEENMQQTTFQDYLEHRLGEAFELEDPLTQMEYVLTSKTEEGYAARIQGIQFKASTQFLQLLNQYVSFLEQEGLIFKDILFHDEVLLSAERLKEQFYSLDSSVSIPNRLTQLTEWIEKELKVKERSEREKSWVEDEMQLLGQEAYQWAYKELKKQEKSMEDRFDDFDREQELLAKRIVEKHFKPIYTLIRRLNFIDITAMYHQLFMDQAMLRQAAPDLELPVTWVEICKHTVEMLEKNVLRQEDATPYLYLKERIEGFQTNPSIRHVFIDEAQDYSAFQFAFIRKLFPHSKMTVLGDWNQAIYTHSQNQDALASLYSLFPEEQTEQVVLRRTYRSTRAIVEFTRELLLNGEGIEPFNREGLPPTCTQVATREELVQRLFEQIQLLQRAGYRTIAVIGKTTVECREVYDRLNEKVQLQLIDKEMSSFQTGIVVIPSYLAKGVEFDAVLIYNASKEVYNDEGERKLFYTACTRAMHELHLFSVGEFSPFLSFQPKMVKVGENRSI
ncbi:RNA polymerase recycling motor HelD [Ammoniphilus sp. CFH 90114]|uniref:RNA polymerase recycling motor HelD n=1 Tax=Ammoniphilus sp. CFH 90114 TaxID=2493665 RepID=UPI00196AA82F|nr:RNA polymerase recycling motor HelD [Ammoniphilus sp. CFH 90114]